MQTHEAGWVRLICSYFAVDFHQSLVHDFLDFVVREGVLQAIAQEYSKRQALTQLVWTAARTRGLQFHTV